jgi:transcriptional regulator GlxA family with amidase domain
VRDSNVFSGGGVTAGIDIALSIVAALKGDDVAKTIQLAIEYAPEPQFASGRPEIAEPHIVDAVKALFAAFAETRRDAIAQMTGRA